MRDFPEIFEPRDFDEYMYERKDGKILYRTPEDAAYIANAKFKAYLDKEGQKVFRLKNGIIVSDNPVLGCEVTFSGQLAPTHEAILIGIKKIHPNVTTSNTSV